MRIGFFTESYFPEIDGVTYTINSWKQRLEQRGHEVYVFYPDSKEYEPEEREVPVRSISNPFYEGYNIPIPPVDLPQLDIVHCHGPFSLGRYGLRHARKNNIPSIYTHHTPVEDYFKQNAHSKLIADFISRLYLPFENRFLNKFDKVTASTESIDREVNSRQLSVGIDTDFFKPLESNMFNDLEGPIAGYSGRISIEKNVDELIEFAEDFKGNLVILGEGPQKKKIKSEAPENVVFKDFLPREELPKFYTAIDVFLTASTGDTLGLSTLEANACGTPVVAADVHPFDKTIQEENGLRYEKGDIEDLKQKVIFCMDKSFETKKAAKRYSMEKTIQNLEKIYRDISNANR